MFVDLPDAAQRAKIWQMYLTKFGLDACQPLTERLSGSDDGKPKVFRDSAVENLREFFERFRHLNIGSNEQLDELVTQAQRIVRGVEPQALQDNQPLRQQIATQLSGVQATLDGLLVDHPRRNIIRKPQG